MNTATILILTVAVLVMCLGVAALIMLVFWPKGPDAASHPLMIAAREEANKKGTR